MRIRIGTTWLLAASLAAAQSTSVPIEQGGSGNDSVPVAGEKFGITFQDKQFFYTAAFGRVVNVVPIEGSEHFVFRFTFTAYDDTRVKLIRLLRKDPAATTVRGIPQATGAPVDKAADQGAPRFMTQSPAPSPSMAVNVANTALDDGVPVAVPTTMPHNGRSEISEDLDARQEALPSFSVTQTGANGEILLDFRNMINPISNAQLVWEVQWDTKTRTGGKSYSRWFAFAIKNSNEAEQLDRTFRAMTNGNPSQPAFPDDQPLGNLPAASTPASAPSPTNTNVDPAIGPPLNGGGTNAAASQASSGLATGAIIGIAVGCGVAGLILVGLLAWFLIRRSRKQRAAGAPYGSDRHRRTAELIAEKEATAGVNDSPHSPYSDDGHGHGHADAPPTNRRGLSSTAGGDAAAGVLLHSSLPDERSYTPYTDAATPRAAPASAAAIPASSRSPSRAAGGARSATPEGRYAHLMSPDMTPEERARIEEEERALDRAIEEAGRASRP